MLSVARGEGHDKLIDALEEQCGEAKPYLHPQLVHCCKGNHRVARNEDDGERHDGNDEKDFEKGIDGKDESREPLEEGHVSNQLAEEEEIELLRSL